MNKFSQDAVSSSVPGTELGTGSITRNKVPGTTPALELLQPSVVSQPVTDVPELFWKKGVTYIDSYYSLNQLLANKNPKEDGHGHHSYRIYILMGE